MKSVIQIDGQTVDPDSGADIVETEAGVYSAIAGGAVFEIRMDDDSVTVGGRRLEFSVEDPRAWKHRGAGAGMHGKASIVAPMPGKVVRILVAAGDEVKQGQGLVVVEAMKMQNEMKAPRDGRVTALEVRENDSVTAGSLLAVVE
jgi:acetyl/propionyl-CoA carboxylase alpha subunit